LPTVGGRSVESHAATPAGTADNGSVPSAGNGQLHTLGPALQRNRCPRVRGWHDERSRETAVWGAVDPSLNHRNACVLGGVSCPRAPLEVAQRWGTDNFECAHVSPILLHACILNYYSSLIKWLATAYTPSVALAGCFRRGWQGRRRLRDIGEPPSRHASAGCTHTIPGGRFPTATLPPRTLSRWTSRLWPAPQAGLVADPSPDDVQQASLVAPLALSFGVLQQEIGLAAYYAAQRIVLCIKKHAQSMSDFAVVRLFQMPL
jgi:hypothetical protein